jgi:hypothetical protein
MKKNSTFLFTKLLLPVFVLLFSYSEGYAQPYAGADDEICTDNTTLTASSVTLPGNWSIVSGSGAFANATSATTFVSGISSGQNIFRWTDQSGFDDVIITNNSVVANAGVDLNVSSGIALLNANDPASQGASGSWAVISGMGTFDSPSAYNTYVRGLQSGQNVFQWTVSKGICFASDDVIVTATPLYAGDDQNVCKDTAYLNATPAAGGYWENLSMSATFIDDNTLYNARVIFLDPTYNPHQFVWHANGLTDTMLVVNNMVYANIVSVPNDVCGDVVLSANQPLAGETGLWTVNTTAIIQEPSLENTLATNLEQGPNYFTWTISNGKCTADSTVLVNSSTVFADAGADIQSCSPDNIQLSANIPGQGIGKWTDLTGSASFSNTSINNAWVSGLNPGINQLEWTIQNNSCFDRDTVEIEVVDVFAGIENGDTIDVCDSVFGIISGNPPIFEMGETGDWLPLNSPVYFDDHTSATTTVRGLVPGVNQMTWNIYNGACFASDTLTINYFNPAKAGVSEDINLFFDNPMNIDTIVNIYAYGEAGSTYGYWTIAQGNATIIDNSINGTVHVVDTSNIIVVGTMGNAACEVSDSILIVTGMTFMPMDTVTYLDWSNPDAWANGMVPGADDSVTIFGVNAFIKGDTAECNAIYISSGSDFQISGGGALFVNTIDLSQNNKRFKATGNASLTIAGDGLLKVGYGETNLKGLRIGSGGILTVDNNPLKAVGDGGSLYVRGGSVIIEQDAEKAAGSGGTMYVRGSVIIEQDAEKSANFKAVGNTSGNNLVIRRGGSVIIEQDAEKSTVAGGLILIRSGGSIIVGDTIAGTLDSTSGLLYVKSGTVNIETPTLKAVGVGNGTLYVRGGSVIIEQDAEKSTYKTEIIAPRTEVYNGQIIIGQLSNFKIVGSGFRTGSIIIEQDAEKSTNVDTSLIIKTGGSLLIDNSLDANAAFSISLGSNTYVTFEDGSEINLNYTGTGATRPIVLKPGASLLDMNTADQLPAKFEYSFMQNIPVLFSSPFVNINSAGFSTDASISTWNETDKAWNSLNGSTDFTAMEGFKIQYPTMNYNSIIEGTLNTGNVSKSLDFSSNGVAGETGWNLTGNPYPSAIVWDSVNTDNISAAVYTYNEQTKQYNVYMKGGLSLNGALPYIEPGKAFFVRANDANVSFSLTNAARVHYDFSTSAKETQNNYLKLEVKGNGYSDEAIIRFLSDASDDYDSQYDAFKLLAEDDAVPQIYSVLQSDDSKMAINTLSPPGDKAITVAVNFEESVDGTYTITANELNFDAAVSVTLKDLKTNTTQDLKANPAYTFDYAQGDPVNRFEIQFGAGITSVNDVEKQELNVDIYANQNSVYIKTFDNSDYRYEIYDMKGKMIQSDKLYNNGLNTIKLNIRQGIYIVKVISGKQSFTKQVPILK